MKINQSSAPELLDALQDFVNEYRLIDAEFLINDEMRAILHKAEAAIKNATS